MSNVELTHGSTSGAALPGAREPAVQAVWPWLTSDSAQVSPRRAVRDKVPGAPQVPDPRRGCARGGADSAADQVGQNPAGAASARLRPSKAKLVCRRAILEGMDPLCGSGSNPDVSSLHDHPVPRACRSLPAKRLLLWPRFNVGAQAKQHTWTMAGLFSTVQRLSLLYMLVEGCRCHRRRHRTRCIVRPVQTLLVPPLSCTFRAAR